jgi:hypothetical protein
MSRLYRFHYRRQREVIVPAQIQIAESPKNLGRFILRDPVVPAYVRGPVKLGQR